MKNICLILEYIGTNYCGFQKQKNGLSVQEVLENAIFCSIGEKVKVCPSGRTDAGVHALGQVVNFCCESKIDPLKFKIIFNLKLPKDIKILKSFEAPKNFNSRKSVKSKTYMYKIFNGENFSVFDENRALFFENKLDLNLLNLASKKLVGTHNFSSFVASGGSAKSFERTIFDAHFEKKDDYICFFITGNGFLYNMVRIIVGTLLDIGTNKKPLELLDILLKGNNRGLAGKTVKPFGLYLLEVKY